LSTTKFFGDSEELAWGRAKTVFNLPGSDLSTLNFLGIAIKGVPGSHHVGVLYRDEDDVPHFCHFAWHQILINGPVDDTFDYYWQNSGLPQITQRLMAGFCQQLATENPNNIPYGFDFSLPIFSAENGAYINQRAGAGLTCATFIYCAFFHKGITLVRFGEWQSRADDQAWQQHIRDLLVANGAPQEHTDAMVADIGAARIRPPEIAVSVPSKSPPIGFAEARDLASQLIALIGAQAEPPPVV
jgi:hypothetical protein